MIIKQKRDIEPKKNSIGIVYGLSGSGKTSLCGKGDTLLIDLEEGASRSIADCEIAQGASLKDVIDIIATSDYQNITIDTGDELVRLISANCKAENPKLQSASQTLRLYGALLDKLIYFIGEVRKSGKNVVFVCHGKRDESTDTARFIPRFGSENNNIELFRVCDFIGYLYSQGVNDRYLTFDPTDFNNCKNSLQIATRKISKTDNIFDILKDARVELSLEFEAKKAERVEYINRIEACATMEELTEIGKELRKINLTHEDVVSAFKEAQKKFATAAA